MHEDQAEVLVVGAGPVGLWTALLLAEAGVQVAIIDREEHTAARSYACALHPRTLRALDRLGLAAPAVQLGHRVRTVAFYEGDSRHAQLNISELDTDFPFLLILPQNAFEHLLEERLAGAGIRVNWNHRFDSLDQDSQSVTATIEELGGSATGYIVPHWETIVKNRRQFHAQFLVGTDGQSSFVRERLGIESDHVGAHEFFVAYEFESDAPPSEEVRLALDDLTTNVLWPLPGNKCRWTFQLTNPQPAAKFPEKERRAVRLAQPAVDEKIREFVQQVAHRRAPWFSAPVRQITWCTQVAFEHRLARNLGINRCWLAGDAAHQTGPAGVQSLNAGFLEAETLCERLRKIIRDNAPLNLPASYEKPWRAEWRRLLGIEGGLSPRHETLPWISQHANRILPCLPACGQDLVRLAAQLKLDCH